MIVDILFILIVHQKLKAILRKSGQLHPTIFFLR